MGEACVDVFDLDIPIDEFDFNKYYEGELYILNPALSRAGYTLMGRWYTSDGDSFGPLVRSVKAFDPQGKPVTLWYG